MSKKKTSLFYERLKMRASKGQGSQKNIKRLRCDPGKYLLKIRASQSWGSQKNIKRLRCDPGKYLQILKDNSIMKRIDHICTHGIIDENDFFSFETNEIDGFTEQFEAVITQLDLMHLSKRRLKLLKELFIKFLSVRLSGETLFLNKVISSLVVSILAVVGEKFGDFQPEVLWKLLEQEGLLCDHKVLVFAARKYVTDNNEAELTDLDFVDISLFGEFLYHCATINYGTESLMAATCEKATEEEKMLIHEISNEITPELGLLTYIVYKNWASNIDIHFEPRERHIYSVHDFQAKDYSSVRSAYCRTYDKVTSIPLLKDYLNLFHRYLGTQISNSGFAFGRGILTLEYFNKLHDYEFPLLHREHPLLFFLKYVHELLLFLNRRDPNFHEGTFQDIPEFLKSRIIPHHNCHDYFEFYNYETPEGIQSMVAMLLAISHFVEFLFVEQWKNRTLCSDNYMKIWSELNNDINTRCDAIKEFVLSFRLFPFYVKSRNTCFDRQNS